jgi:hypothetical protein
MDRLVDNWADFIVHYPEDPDDETSGGSQVPQPL